MKYIVHQRQVNPHLYSELMWNIFGFGREQRRLVKVLHDFTGTVIRARARAVAEAGGVKALNESERERGHSRMAFLDLMLDMMDKGEIDLAGIQEEVDTFTFEVCERYGRIAIMSTHARARCRVTTRLRRR